MLWSVLSLEERKRFSSPSRLRPLIHIMVMVEAPIHDNIIMVDGTIPCPSRARASA